MKYFENNEAVSEGIGVILIVALTVVLAAIFGSSVFGMAGTIPKSKEFAVTVSKGTFYLSEFKTGSFTDLETGLSVNPNPELLIIATIKGGKDIHQMRGLDWTINGVESYLFRSKGGASYFMNEVCPGPGEGATAGTWFPVYTWDLKSGTKGTQDHVVITVYFCDGSQQVVLDTWV